MSIPEQKGQEGRYLEEADVDETLKSKVRYFGNRICPFAHRAWWAAVETGFEMDYIHINLQATKPAWYPEKVNPAGTVPALFVEGHPIFESAIVANYIDDVTGNTLYPSDPILRADARLLQTIFGEKVIGKLYQYLGGSVEWDAVKKELEMFDQHYMKLKQQDGPFFTGAALSMVEIFVLPFIHRFSILLPHYRGIDFFGDAAIPGLKAAHEAAMERDAFKQTILTPEEFIVFYSGYAAKK